MSAMARSSLVPCPACDRVVTITGAGTYRAHRDDAGDPCPWGGTPAEVDTPEIPPVSVSAVPPVESPAMPPKRTAPEPEPEPTPEPVRAPRASRDTARVGNRGQFTLPPAIRERIGIEEGDVLHIAVNEDGTLTLTPMRLQPLPPPAAR